MRLLPVRYSLGMLCLILPSLLVAGAADAPKFTIGTYNLEGYLDVAIGTRQAKDPASKLKVQETIVHARPDILALQEMGRPQALTRLRNGLAKKGLDYPYWDHITGFDTNIHLAVLSRYPIISKRPHTNLSYLLYGRRFRVSRGFAEMDIGIGNRYRLTLITAHLKSKLPIALADEADMRENEALLLRRIIDQRLADRPDANLIVLGDLNDHPASRPVRIILGRGKRSLTDIRPAERNGDNLPNPKLRYAPRNIVWTYYYGKEDLFSRIDYLLLSPGLTREWDPTGTYIVRLPNWGIASDHRLLVAQFSASDR